MIDCEIKLEDSLRGEGYEFLEGYMQALTNLYALTYNLSIDRQQIERDHHAKLGL